MLANEIFELFNYLREFSIGMLVFLLILIIPFYISRRIVYRGSLLSLRDIKRNKPYYVLLWISCVTIGLACAHLVSIFSWGLMLRALNLMPSLSEALLYAGSCYTTLGFMPNQLEMGWRMLSILIAISGLMSFAISTAALLGMSQIFKEALQLLHKKRIERDLIKYGMTWDDFK